MATTIKSSSVVYVEPNAEPTLGTAYDIGKGEQVMKFANPEDFCIIVDLEVEVKGRTRHFTKKGSSSTMKMESTENASGQRIRFMEGTKIYTKKDGSEYINSLTTNYTDCSLHDVQNGGTSEMFGIKSVDISYNNFMVPEVTIQFVDVRGVSLFAQEELRHNLVKDDGMTGIVNNDIQGSFFKCFFTFPYPKFTLRVKGFYGQMVSYNLTCSDFRAAFESTTGNFNVTAKFVGYAFSFLNDIMANAILAAPYSTYIGSEYWDKNNGPESRFYLRNSNGSKVSMKRLMDICKEYEHIKETVEKKLAGAGRDEYLEQLGVSKEDRQLINNVDLNEYRQLYKLRIDELVNKGFVTKSNGEICIPAGHSYAVIVDDDTDYAAYDTVMNNFDEADIKFRSAASGCTQLQNWYNDATHKFKITRFESYSDIAESDEITIKTDKFKDQNLATAIANQATKPAPSDSKKQYHDLWTDLVNSHVYIYEDLGLYDILGETSEVTPDDAAKAQATLEKATQVAMNKEMEKVFDFPPTLENVTKLIMAHLETYAYMISTCAKTIIDSGNARSIGKLGLKNALNDMPSGTTTSNTLVPPFPSVTENRTDSDGNERVETTWIGKFGDSNKYEEIKLVEGLLDGLEAEAAAVEPLVSGGEDAQQSIPQKSNITNPLSYLDFFLESGDKAFGNINMSDTNDIFAHVALRAFTAYCISKGGNNGQDFGTLDAENFYNIYCKGNDVKILKECLTSLAGDQIYTFITDKSNNNLINKSAKSKPWKPLGYDRLFMPASDETNYIIPNCRIQPDAQGMIFPIKNWNFNGLKEERGNGAYSGKYGSPFYITPIPNESYNLKATVCKVKYKACAYFLNTVGQSTNSIFTDAKETASHAIQVYTVGTGVDTNKSINQIHNLIKYDDNGGVSNPNDFALSFYSCFGKSEYYSQPDLYHKAYYFLNSFTTSNISPLYTQLYDDAQKVRVMPKLILLKLGAKLWKDLEQDGKSTKLRRGIAGTIIREFKNWAGGNDFASIRSSYEFKFKNGKSFSTLVKAVNENGVEKGLNSDCDNVATITSVYNVAKGASGKFLNLDTKPCNAMASMISDLCQTAHLVILGKYNNNEYSAIDKDGPMVKISDMKAYFNSFVTKLKELLNVSSETDTSSGATATIDLDASTDNDDLRFGVYAYLKLLYDKWIAADLDITDYKFETMFDDADPEFHFIDAYYNKIGKSYYINLGTLVNYCVISQQTNGYTLLSLLSDLYSSNKMQIICLQNFANLAKEDMMEKMFKPIPYVEKEEPSNHQDFVVLYPGEPSSKLEIKDGDYKDDGFYLNEETTWPVMVKNKQGGYPIPAFGVSYGQQYQSYFTNIQVDMNTPMVTEQSIKAKFMIAGGATGNDNNGPREITVGQDLYTIYANNSYTCTVTMMGCAWVQPMMYFVLLNVPMFRGSYQIVKVGHKIQAGQMTTTFTGVRMANTSTRAVRQYIAGQNNNSNDGNSGSAAEGAAQAAANIGNDCDYAFNSPLGSGAAGEANVNGIQIHNNRTFEGSKPNGEQQANIKNIVPTIKSEGAALKYNVPWSVIAAMCEHESHWSSSVIYQGKTPSSSTAKGIGQFLHSTAKLPLFASIFTNLDKADMKPDDRNKPQLCVKAMVTYINHNLDKYAKKYPDMKNDPMKLLLISLAQYGSSDNEAKSTYDALKGRTIQQAIDGGVLPTKNGINYYLTYVYKFHTQYTTSVTSTSATTQSGDTITQLMSGFTPAVQASLNATESYKDAKLTAKKGATGKDFAWVIINGTGTNVLNATYDCIGTTYSDYWEKLFWCIGSGGPSNDATSVWVKLVTTKPTNHFVGVCDNNGDTKNITKADEVNKFLKLCLIKYCKKINPTITDTTKAKAAMLSLKSMNDATLKSLLELGTSGTSAVESCNSVIGGKLGEAGSGFDGGSIKDGVPTSFKKNEAGKYNLVLHRYGEVGKNITGVIYEYDTGKVLCYTIENTTYVYSKNRPDIQLGVHSIGPGANSWPNEKAYHRGCSSYTVKLIGGQHGFGSKTGAANTMLKIGNNGCLFHPGMDYSWSEGCILIGNKANDKGKRSFTTSNYNVDKISTSTDAAVVAYRNFYNNVCAQIIAGKKVQIEIVKNYSKQPTAVGTSSNASSPSGTKLVSLSKALTSAGYKNGTDFEMIIPYATSNNFTGAKIEGYKSGQNDCYACQNMADKVVKAIKWMKEKYGTKYKLAIMDCYRPQTAAVAMGKYAQKHNISTAYVARVSGGVSQSAHCKGAAIDLTLKDGNGYVNMNAGSGTGPGGFDEFSTKAHYSGSGNQKILHDIMCTGGGLSAYKNEWWHFGSGGGAEGETITYG